MLRMPKESKEIRDPALIDFLLENRLAYKIIKILNESHSGKTEGWLKVPDIVAKVQNSNDFGNFKNVKSTVHYVCKRLHEKFEAIDKHESHRPAYYRLNDKGKRHLSAVEGRIERKGVG
jgi:hypothetical protein